MKDTEGLRALARERRRAPRHGIRRWEEMVESGREKCAATSGIASDATSRQYFEQCTNLKRSPISVWFLHVLLGVERSLAEVRNDRQGALTSSQLAGIERSYHYLSGAVALLDQQTWDNGDLLLASRVSLLDAPQPPARPDAPKVKLSPDDVLKVHSPLVSEDLANTAGVAGANELDLLDKKNKLAARRKAAGH